MHRRNFVLSTSAALISYRLSQADEPAANDLPAAMTFGHLRGRFVYDGEPPKPKPIRVYRDADAFRGVELFDETVRVDPKTKGLGDVLIALEAPTGADAQPLTTHKSYEETARDQAVLEYRGSRMQPRVLAVRNTQTIKVVNSDRVVHNCNAHLMKNAPFNVLLAADHSHERALKETETLPSMAVCNIHPWERAFIAVYDHPYFAVTAEDGSFEIRNLPIGRWTFRLWHESAGYLVRGDVGGEQIAFQRGRHTIEIRLGMTDLGDIKISPELFPAE